MSEVEVENKVEAPSKEISYMIGTYLTGFSRPPFNEKWVIDGYTSSDFLLNPKTTGDFVNEIFQQDELEIFPSSDGGEQIKVEKGMVLKHIQRTLNCPMTEHLSKTGWFSEDAKEELLDIGKSINESEERFLYIQAPFPLTKILNAYTETMNRPRSLVVLGYQDESGFSLENKMQFLRLGKDTLPSGKAYPRFAVRLRTINHPEIVKTPSDSENLQKVVFDEIGYYFAKDELKTIANKIDPNLYTCYLGEIVKIDEFNKNLSGIIFAGNEYLKVLTSDLGDEINYEKTNLAPEQIVYLSIEGTNVIKSGRDRTSGSNLFLLLKRLLKPFDLQFKEEILSFDRPNRQNVVLGIIKQIKNERTS